MYKQRVTDRVREQRERGKREQETDERRAKVQ
jgi:hypothetical protein